MLAFQALQIGSKRLSRLNSTAMAFRRSVAVLLLLAGSSAFELPDIPLGATQRKGSSAFELPEMPGGWTQQRKPGTDDLAVWDKVVQENGKVPAPPQQLLLAMSKIPSAQKAVVGVWWGCFERDLWGL